MVLNLGVVPKKGFRIESGGTNYNSRLFYFDERGEVDLSEFVTELSWEHKAGQIPKASVKLMFTKCQIRNAPQQLTVISASFPELREKIEALKE